MPTPRINPAALESYLKEQIRHIHRELKDFDGDLPEKSVHKARVATRRVKAVLMLVAPLVNKSSFKALRQASKRLRRELGPIRELDVMIRQLTRLKPRPPVVDELIKTLVQSRQRRMAKVSGLGLEQLVKKVELRKQDQQKLRQLRQATTAMIREAVLKDFEAFRERADAAASSETSVDLHALRVTAKEFRYQLEIAERVGFPRATQAAKRFERIQDQLGAWHDEVILAERIARFALEESLFERCFTDAVSLNDLCQDRLHRAEASLKAFRADWVAARDTLFAMVQELAALPVNTPKADRGRSSKR